MLQPKRKMQQKDLVLKAKEKAYQDILNAQTTNDVTQIKDQAVTDIQGITADTTIKDVAKGELTAKANEQKRLLHKLQMRLLKKRTSKSTSRRTINTRKSKY